MTKTTPIILDRLAAALSRQGVKIKRMQVLEAAAAAFGYRNSHELAAADAQGDLSPPQARLLGRKRIPNIGWMIFLQDPDGTVFAIDQERFDAQDGRAADWINSPLGGVLDVSQARLQPSMATDGLYLGGPPPHVPNLCQEIAAPDTDNPDWEADTPERLFRPDFHTPINLLEPAYMTSGCCEVASVTPEDLDALGLPYGEFDGTFYPLTDQEGGYIAEDVVDARDGLHSALIGYAVLYKGAKHLMPTIELANGPEDDFPPREEVLRDATSYAERIRPKVVAMGGDVLLDTGIDDRVLVQILVPLENAMAVGDFEAWKSRLAWLMVDPDLPTVISTPIRHTGRDFAVEVAWIGEGEDGDYDPEDPNDTPLLRFDGYRLVDGAWEEEPDSSYCTQVPAWCSPAQARALARYIAETLDEEGGASNKRLLERMSWTDLAAVEAARQEQAALDALGADAFVAHVTYGDPDRGTSVDLRRRTDGSVRCEVYIDLDCAAVLDAPEGIEAVRAWLKTLESDIENAEGPNQPSHALAPVWDDPEAAGRDGVRWMLVPADEDEAAWFADVPPAAPFERRFVLIDDMTV